MLRIRFTTTQPQKGFQSALKLELTKGCDIFNFMSELDRHDFEVMLGTLCKANRIGISVVLGDILIIGNSQDKIESFLDSMYTIMDSGAECTVCRTWSFHLEGIDGGFRFFLGDRAKERPWIEDNFKLLHEIKI